MGDMKVKKEPLSKRRTEGKNPTEEQELVEALKVMEISGRVSRCQVHKVRRSVAQFPTTENPPHPESSATLMPGSPCLNAGRSRK